MTSYSKRPSVGRARGAERRLEAQALLLQARMRLRRVLACKGHAGSPRAYLEIQALAGEVEIALREVRGALAIVAVLPPPVIEVDPPSALARDLARDPDDSGPWPPSAA